MNFHDLGIWAREGYEAGNEPAFLASHSRVTEVQGAMLRVQLSRLPRSIARLKTNRKIVEQVVRQAGLRPSPHNDPASAATVTVIFDTEQEAAEFARRPGVYRIYDNSKHVYTNWDPIINHRTSHPKLNPWAWAHRRISYDEATCARTLAIMRRSCRLHVSASWPAPLMRFVARTLYRPNSTDGAAYRLMERLKGA